VRASSSPHVLVRWGRQTGSCAPRPASLDRPAGRSRRRRTQDCPGTRCRRHRCQKPTVDQLLHMCNFYQDTDIRISCLYLFLCTSKSHPAITSRLLSNYRMDLTLGCGRLTPRLYSVAWRAGDRLLVFPPAVCVWTCWSTGNRPLVFPHLVLVQVCVLRSNLVTLVAHGRACCQSCTCRVDATDRTLCA